MIKAVLFDFDGVIANTLTYHVQAWREVFRPYNIAIGMEDIAVIEGARTVDIAAKLVREKQLSFSVEQLQDLTEQKRRIYHQITKATVYPSIKTFIDKLKARSYQLGLVTGSVISSMNKVVDNKFLKNFQVIITSDDVTNGKPDPEPYLLAARRLRVSPANCLVIENAPYGIRAAKNADMKCIALKTTIQDNQILSEADLIVNDASEIDIDSWDEIFIN